MDIGLNQAAFIHVNDLISEGARRRPVREEPREEEADGDDNSEHTWEHFESNVPIEDLLREGQEIMVHVAKSPIGTKGARITCHVSLPGRFLVMMPTSDHNRCFTKNRG